MARLIEHTFDPTKPVMARRFFVAAGRHFNPGDVFDWKRSSVDQRRVRMLFDAGKLYHPEPTVTANTQPVETPAAPIVAEEAPIEAEIHDDNVHHAASTAEAASTVEDDGLEDLGMKELRAIAVEENAPFRVSREAQRDAIREARRATA